ncbi:ACP S-malonyltransferase [Iamia majanohamensis]|uniref:Malonyl CoA-acyl carrier protein transacylase n=1 Tax=Iamia majanohamensis TaxID=467976 RepID=A0AAE9YC00_9ACTN|nr:ACP S-malonyltransferase [Iamia majanohamensis]WCO68373.1 ACP S-malonyltransferase [Iamia majanohamensis]
MPPPPPPPATAADPPPGGLDTIAVVFPGQGSQAPAAGRAWVGHPAWAVVEEAEEAAGRPLAPLLLDAEADLGRTEDAQLAVLLASLLAWEAARPLLDAPAAVAGHSLGQITALVATGALDLPAAVRLAAARAELTQRCAEDTPGGLVALLGADRDQADAAVAEVDEAWVANDNAPGQLVLGGTPAGLEAATVAARAAGVRKVRPLDVGGAFHTPLMAPAAAALRPIVAATPFRPTTTPVVTNHDARPHHAARGWDDRLTTHLVRPVRWRESVDALAALGVRRVVEVGPGTTLGSLVTRCRPELATSHAATPAEVEDLLPALYGVGA